MARASGTDLQAAFQAARQDDSLAVLEGLHTLKHALRFGAVVERAVSPEPERIADLARDLAPDLVERISDLLEPVEKGLFRTLSPHPPTSPILSLARRPRRSAGEVLASAQAPAVLLEAPRHHGNLGAVVRSAAAAGAAAVLTTGPLDPWHPAGLRGSAGLHFAVPVLRLGETVAELPPSAGPLVALHPEGEPLEERPLPGGAVLLFGTERGGLSPEALERADIRLRLPMRPGVSSLNLACAVTAVLYRCGPWGQAGR